MVVILHLHTSSSSLAVWMELSWMVSSQPNGSGLQGLAGLDGHWFGLPLASPSEASLDFSIPLIQERAVPREPDPASTCLLNYCLYISCSSCCCHKKPRWEQLKGARASFGSQCELVPHARRRHGIRSMRHLFTLRLQSRSREMNAHT